MKSYLLRLQEELYDQIEARAKKNGRSVNSEIVETLKSIAIVPMVGSVQKDGTVEIDPAYADYLAGKTLDPRD